jgi:hypothetical protein
MANAKRELDLERPNLTSQQMRRRAYMASERRIRDEAEKWRRVLEKELGADYMADVDRVAAKARQMRDGGER